VGFVQGRWGEVSKEITPALEDALIALLPTRRRKKLSSGARFGSLDRRE
jgi:hypothetical protein